MEKEKDGVWRTIRGRRIFIASGESLGEAMKKSGKFEKISRETMFKANRENEEQNLFERGTKRIRTVDHGRTKQARKEKEYEKLDNEIKKEIELERERHYYDNPKISKELENGKHVNKKQKEILERYKAKKQSNNKVDPYDDPESEESQRLQSIQSRYDEYLQDTERRGASYGEIAYVDSLRGKDLDDFEKELDDYETKKFDKQEKIKNYTEKKKSNNKLNNDGLSKEEEKELRENYSNSARIDLGKVDYYGNGRKVNSGYLELELKNGRFSASGGIKNGRGTDSIIGGQALDDMEPYFKNNEDFNKIRGLWKKYHFNNMHAGTEKQETALEKKFGNRNASNYDEHVKYLKSIGIYEDNGYKYGTGWLKRDIPTKDLQEIKRLIEKYNKK